MSPTTANLIYLVFALGGVGIFLLMPRGEKGPNRALTRAQWAAGVLLGLLAVVVLLVTLAFAPEFRADAADTAWRAGGYFHLFAFIAILAAARVITHPIPVYSALYFVLVVVAVAALLVLQRAEFLAVALIIVYAGAILVTYLFVIMLAHQGGSPIHDHRAREPFLAVAAGFVLMAVVTVQAGDVPHSIARGDVEISIQKPDRPAGQDDDPLMASNTLALGAVLMTRYVVVVQLAGVLLLVSMIGAIALSRKRVPSDVPAVPRPPLGQIGKEVPPF